MLFNLTLWLISGIFGFVLLIYLLGFAFEIYSWINPTRCPACDEIIQRKEIVKVNIRDSGSLPRPRCVYTLISCETCKKSFETDFDGWTEVEYKLCPLCNDQLLNRRFDSICCSEKLEVSKTKQDRKFGKCENCNNIFEYKLGQRAWIQLEESEFEKIKKGFMEIEEKAWNELKMKPSKQENE